MNFPNNSDFKTILDSAIYWTQIDFNEESKKEIEGLLALDNFTELKKRFQKHIGFGKEAGVISAKLGAGFSRINFVTIQLLGHGIAEHLWDTYSGGNDIANLGVVIGYDSRYDSQGLS